MSLDEMLEKYVNQPRKEALEQEIEELDTAVKRFKEIVSLDDDERLKFFLNIVKKKLKVAEKMLLSTETSDPIKRECIGEMRSLSAVLDWKQYYLTAIKETESAIAEYKKELETGERPDDEPNN